MMEKRKGEKKTATSPEEESEKANKSKIVTLILSTALPSSHTFKEQISSIFLPLFPSLLSRSHKTPI